WFDAGVNLSGGEWQKVALARAFMREDARILLLDEPTSALDAQAEYDLFERLRSLTQGRTAVYISHRFSTVRRADRIIFLEHGRLQPFFRLRRRGHLRQLHRHAIAAGRIRVPIRHPHDPGHPGRDQRPRPSVAGEPRDLLPHGLPERGGLSPPPRTCRGRDRG